MVLGQLAIDCQSAGMAKDSLFEISRTIVFYRDFNFGCFIRYYLVYSPILPMIDVDGLAPQKQSMRSFKFLEGVAVCNNQCNDQEYLINDV